MTSLLEFLEEEEEEEDVLAEINPVNKIVEKIARNVILRDFILIIILKFILFCLSKSVLVQSLKLN